MSDLRTFLKQLEERDDLIRIKEPLSAKLEVAAALRRFDAGKALLFEKVEGYDTKVVGGIYGTRRGYCTPSASRRRSSTRKLSAGDKEPEEVQSR